MAIDSVTPSVFVMSEEGDLIRWFDCSNHMKEPSDVAIHGREYYICDFKVRLYYLSRYVVVSLRLA